MNENPRLHPSIVPYLEIDGPERVGQCWPIIWVPTPQGQAAFSALDRLRLAPDSPKPVGLILMGESDTGKSRTMEEYAARYGSGIVDPKTEYAQFEVVYVLSPTKPDRPALLKRILAAIGHGVRGVIKEEALHDYAVDMLKLCGTKVILIDELQQVEELATNANVRAFLRGIKALINDTRRPVVVGGTRGIVDFLRSEPQIRSRVENRFEMKPMEVAEEVKALLTFERYLPLRRATDLRANPDTIGAIQSYSRGYIGRVARLLQAATYVAIETGEERLTRQMIDEVGRRMI